MAANNCGALSVLISFATTRDICAPPTGTPYVLRMTRSKNRSNLRVAIAERDVLLDGGHTNEPPPHTHTLSARTLKGTTSQ